MDPIDHILATAINLAQAMSLDAKLAAVEAAEAYKAGVAAYQSTTPPERPVSKNAQ